MQESDFDDRITIQSEIINLSEILEEDELKVPDNERRTTRKLTKFERARVIGVRAKQLENDAPSTIDTGDLTDTLLIAQKELEANKLPLTIRRFLPDGRYEDWKVCELY